MHLESLRFDILVGPLLNQAFEQSRSNALQRIFHMDDPPDTTFLRLAMAQPDGKTGRTNRALLQQLARLVGTKTELRVTLVRKEEQYFCELYRERPNWKLRNTLLERLRVTEPATSLSMLCRAAGWDAEIYLAEHANSYVSAVYVLVMKKLS